MIVDPKKSGGFFPVAKRLELIDGSLAQMEWFGRASKRFPYRPICRLLVDRCRQS